MTIPAVIPLIVAGAGAVGAVAGAVDKTAKAIDQTRKTYEGFQSSQPRFPQNQGKIQGGTVLNPYSGIAPSINPLQGLGLFN